MWKFVLLTTIFTLVLARYFIVGPAKIIILETKLCDKKQNYPMQFELKPHMLNKTTQVIDAFMGLPVDFDENVTMSLKCSRIDKHKTQSNSFTINESEACSTLLKYVGGLWMDIQSQIGMEVGVCPIQMGNYSVKSMYLDLTKLNVQMILEGKFKTRVIFKQFTKTLFCGDFILELLPKNQ